MKSRLTIRQVFAALVAAAIALTPSSRLAMAATPSDAPAMAHEMVMPSMDAAQDNAQDMAMSMPGDEAVEMGLGTPCCPHKAPSPVDCDKCVMMLSCMAKCFSGTAVIADYLLPPLVAAIVPQRNEAPPTSVGRPPPEHPPRSLV